MKTSLHTDPGIATTLLTDVHGPEVASFRPLGDWVLVEPELEGDETESGIVVVREEKERPVRGTVLAVAEDRRNGPIITGARVVFGRYAGTEIELDEQMYLLMRAETDIYGVLDD
jgi:chaperonin GroES